MTDYSKFVVTAQEKVGDTLIPTVHAEIHHTNDHDWTISLELMGWEECNVRNVLSVLAVSALWFSDRQSEDGSMSENDSKMMLDLGKVYKERYDFLTQYFSLAEVEGILAPGSLLENRIFQQ